MTTPTPHRNRILIALSRWHVTSPYMRWWWRHLPEVQPFDLQPLIERVRRHALVCTPACAEMHTFEPGCVCYREPA